MQKREDATISNKHMLLLLFLATGGTFDPGAVNTQMAVQGASLNMFGGELSNLPSFSLLIYLPLFHRYDL